MTGAQGNVIFCAFGAAGSESGADDAGSNVAGIKSAIAEIDAVSKDILSANLAVAQYERENSRLLLKAVGRLDNVAFQSGLLAGSATGGAGDPLESAAADAQRLASAGVAAAHWLRLLAVEQKDRVISAAQALQEVDAQISVLEELMHACLEPVAAGMLGIESRN